MNMIKKNTSNSWVKIKMLKYDKLTMQSFKKHTILHNFGYTEIIIAWLEIFTRHQIFPTWKWKLPRVWNSDILKMFCRIVTFYFSSNCQLISPCLDKRWKLRKTRKCIAMIWCIAKIYGHLWVQTKLLIKPLCHRYFSSLTFACS